MGKGQKVPEVCKTLGVTGQTYYRWRQKYGVIAPERLPNSASAAVFWARPENGGDAFTEKAVARYKNGYIESFNSRFRQELLDRELFLGLEDARWCVDRWRLDYNHYRPHSSLGYVPPAEFAARWPTSAPGPASATPQQAPSLRRASGVTSTNPDSLITAGT